MFIAAQAIQISPSTTNSTHEIYDIAYRISSGDSIICSTEICIINCSGDNNCKTLTISANASNSLYFSCQGSYTCEDTVISSAPITDANLFCDGRVACRDAQWSLSTTTNVNLLCTTDYDGSTSQCMYSVPVLHILFFSFKTVFWPIWIIKTEKLCAQDTFYIIMFYSSVLSDVYGRVKCHQC